MENVLEKIKRAPRGGRNLKLERCTANEGNVVCSIMQVLRLSSRPAISPMELKLTGLHTSFVEFVMTLPGEVSYAYQSSVAQNRHRFIFSCGKGTSLHYFIKAKLDASGIQRDLVCRGKENI